MRIGKVYANAEREEDRADQTFIKMGAIAGEGLLGAVIEAVDRLCEAFEDYGRARSDALRCHQAGEKREAAWLELFAVLKAIEDRAEKIRAVMENASHAMIWGNVVNAPVPTEVIECWFASIEEVL